MTFLQRQSSSDETTGAGAKRAVGVPCACLLPAGCPACRALPFCPALGQGLASQRGCSPTLCVREQHFTLGLWMLLADVETTLECVTRQRPTGQPPFPSIADYSKQSWQKVKLPCLSWEIPFPFSLPHHTPLVCLVRFHV